MTQAPRSSLPPRTDADGPLQSGTRFGKFEIKERIGRGGYASVYHAFDTILHRDVAIKVLHRVGGVSDDMLRRGVIEAQLMCQLRHKNIVEVYDANITESGLLYLVMELLVGQTLWQVLRRYERLAVEEACSIAMQIADGVEVAHQRGAIHRDLKPENVFVTEGNVVKVLDFGIAKVVHGAQGHTTRPDAIQGTVLYMSPEQIGGHRLTGRSDIYALGNILFEMLYGKHPCLLQNPDADSLAVAWLQTYEIPPALDSIAPYCPRHVSRIVSQTLSKRADQRPASMRALREALEASRTRFVEDSGGELKGQFRDLSGVSASSEHSGPATQTNGRFPWFSKAIPFSPDTEPQESPRPSGALTVAVAGAGLQAPRGPTDATTTPGTPVGDPSPIALRAVLRQPQAGVAPARKRRIPLRLVATFWGLSMVGGFAVSLGITKAYLHHRRQPASLKATIEASVASESAATVPVVGKPIPTGGSFGSSSATVVPPPASASANASASALAAGGSEPAALKGAPPARKTRKLEPKEARLRALEEKLNRGTLGPTQ